VALLRRAIHEIFVNEDEPAREAMARLERENPGVPELAELVAFVRASEAGRSGRQAEVPGGGAAPRPESGPPTPRPA
jgi:hypothetical protein